MYQTINGWQGVTTWKEYKLTLLKSQFVSQKLKPYGKDMKKPCACRPCGEIGHNHKKTRMNTLIIRGLSKELAEDLRELRLEIVPKGFVAAMEVQSTLLGKIHEAQKDDKEISYVKDRISK